MAQLRQDARFLFRPYVLLILNEGICVAYSGRLVSIWRYTMMFGYISALAARLLPGFQDWSPLGCKQVTLPPARV